MKKKLLFGSLLLMVLLCGCSIACAQTTTILMYMCGTDLQADCLADMAEMMAVDLPDEVQVIVQAGGAAQWSNSRLAAGQLNRFRVGSREMLDLHTAGSGSMGDPNTLVDFISFGLQNYPADRYGLILWDHGGGSTNGICFDQTANDDSITLADFNYALYQVTQELYPDLMFDFIGCDACLMATYEMAVNARYYAKYYVASEELEPGWGWYYTPWLQALAAEPDMPSDVLCSNIASSYYEYCYDADPQEYLTISVIDLAQFEKVVSCMEDFASYLAQAMNDGHFNAISRVRSQVYAFGSYYNASSDMIDLEAFVTACQDFAPNTATRLLAAIHKAVIYEQHNEDMFDYACGLSILLPYDSRQYFDSYISNYDSVGYMPNYTDLLKGYVSMLNGGSYVFTMETPTFAENSYVFGSTFNGFDNMLQTAFLGGSAVSYEPEEQTTEQPDAPVETEAETDSADNPVIDNPVIDPGVSADQQPETRPEEEPEEEPEQEPEQEPDEASQPAEESGPGVEQYDPENLYAYSMTLSDEDMANLSYVEGKLMLNVNDGQGLNFFVDLGQLQNAQVDWENNTVYSMFDGSWPTLMSQPVMMIDQVKTEKARRAVIPVKVNDTACYLLVVFDAKEQIGVVRGYSEGYDENGLPVRGVTKLAEGDVIVPSYTMYYDDENGESVEAEFDGDPITFDGQELTVAYESLTDDGDDETNYYYCFCLNDIYGDFQLSDVIVFE